MPSSGWDEIDEDTRDYVMSIYADAEKHGLQAEWGSWFLGGIKAGKPIRHAAYGAAIEWDF